MIQSQQISLEHLSEFGKEVEGNIASLAAQRISNNEAELLLALVETARRYVHGDTADRDAFLETDKRFHRELARISANPVYIFVTETVHENIHRYYDRFLSMKSRNWRRISRICRILPGPWRTARQMKRGCWRKAMFCGSIAAWRVAVNWSSSKKAVAVGMAT